MVSLVTESITDLLHTKVGIVIPNLEIEPQYTRDGLKVFLDLTEELHQAYGQSKQSPSLCQQHKLISGQLTCEEKQHVIFKQPTGQVYNLYMVNFYYYRNSTNF